MSSPAVDGRRRDGQITSMVSAFQNDDVAPAVAMMRGIDPARAGQWSEAFFRWKHVDNPFGASIGLVERDDVGALIALRMLQRWELERDGFTVQAVRAVDTATAPPAQGKGLFRKLTLQAVDVAVGDDIDLVFNTPNEKSGAGYLKMGWHEVGRPGVFLRATRPPLWGRLTGDDVDPEHLAAVARREPVSTERLRTRRIATYFRWRYVDVPGFEYRMYSAGLATVVFRRQRRRGVPELTIVELLHPDTLRGARDAAVLIRELVNHGGAFVISAVAPLWSTTAAALVGAGFVWTPLGPRLFVRPLAMRRIDPLPTSTSDWALGIGDLEIF